MKPLHKLESAADLKPAAYNPRKISTLAAKGLTASMSEWGDLSGITWNERTGHLVAGHQRVDQLQKLGAVFVPPTETSVARFELARPSGAPTLVFAVRVVDWDLATEKAANIAANNQRLAGEFTGGIDALLEEVRASLGPESFDRMQFNALADDLGIGKRKVVEDVVPPVPATSVVRAGDVWHLGPHRLLCGDCTKPEVARLVIEDGSADICWTDPPWNVAVVGGSRAIPAEERRRAGKLTIANDNLGAEFPAFCVSFVTVIERALRPGAALYMAMAASEWPTIALALRASGFHWSSTIVWAKNSLVLGRSDYHPQYEPIWYGWHGGAARLVPLKDRKQSDLWAIDRPSRSEEHPTMKPVELVARAIQNSSRAKAVVFEPFSGSGTTIIACEQTGRVARAIEIAPVYVEVAIRRWEALTGNVARLESGETLDALAKTREATASSAGA